MNKNRYGELLSLANALEYISDSDLLWSLMKDAGYSPNTFDLHILVELVAKHIYLELTA